MPAEITLCLVNDPKIRGLNLKYLGEDIPTDVLAFDATGDIVISTDTAIRNAAIYKTSPVYETYLYVVHGVLHLLGYDDRNPKGRKLMDNKAKTILKNYVHT